MSYCPDPLSALIFVVNLQVRPPDLYAETFYRKTQAIMVANGNFIFHDEYEEQQHPVKDHLHPPHYHTVGSSENIVEPISGSVSDAIRERILTAYYTPSDFRAK